VAFVRPKDRVLERSTTSGSQTVFALAGAVDVSYNAFSSAMSVGDTTIGTVVEPGVAFKSGVLTYSATNQVTVTTTYESKGSFGAGTKEIFMGLPAARAVYRNGDQTIDGALAIGGALDVAGTVHAALSTVSGPSTSTGSEVGSFIAKGGSGASGGGLYSIAKNGVIDWLWGHKSSVLTSASSSNWLLYKNGIGNAAEVDAATLSWTFGGEIIAPASTVSRASLRVPTGTAPTSPIDGDIWNDGANVRARVGSTTKNLTPSLIGFIGGLALSAAGGTGTFGIATGAAADSAGADIMTLASVYTKTTGAWSVGSGNGALDTGAIAASTWYHVWLIKRPDTFVTDVLVSLSASSPTMPANYTLKRRIGSMKSDGSSQWIKFTQTGDTFIWDASKNDLNSGATFLARTSLVLTVPTGVVVEALFRATLFPGVAIYLNFTSLQESDQAPGTAGINDMRSEPATIDAGSFARLTNTSAQIGYRADLNSGAGTLTVATYGWRDTRGK
jgi:hypothetical protein